MLLAAPVLHPVVPIPTHAHHVHHYPGAPGCQHLACAEHVWHYFAVLYRRRVRQLEGQIESPETSQSTTTASWYDANSGPTACGPHEALGVANKTLPCGTRVRICYAGCEVAVVDDRGPYVEGRELDLSPGAKAAISCTDLCSVRYSVLG